MQTLFGDSNLFSDNFLNQILSELFNNGRILRHKNGYILSDKEISRIESKIGRAYEEDSVFYRSILEKSEELSEDQKNQIRLTVAKGIGIIFERKGIEIASALCDKCESLTINSYPEINIISKDVASSLDQTIRHIAQNSINRLFSNPTDFEAEYLFGIAESYLVYASFDLDPDARILDLESARENILIIDTDVLLQLFIGSEEKQTFYKKMLKISKNMGITMHTFPQMIHEFVYKIKASHDDYVYMNRPPNFSASTLNELGDVFIYYFERVAHTGKTWDQFIASLIGGFKQDKKNENFVEKRLDIEYSVTCRDLSSEISIDKKEIQDFAADLIRLRTTYRSHKHDDLYENDALNALSIETLQKQNSELQYWLLSNDGYLHRVWQKRTKESKVRLFPTENWFQYISNHPASKSKPVDFSALMKSISVSPSRPQIHRNLLLTLIKFGVNVSQYTTESLEELNKRLYNEYIWQKGEHYAFLTDEL